MTPTGPVPVRLNHLNAGSVPDLGPDTVDRIAGVNQYLQQRWTNYFGGKGLLDSLYATVILLPAC